MCVWLTVGLRGGEYSLKAVMLLSHASRPIACGVGGKALLYTLPFHLKSPTVQGPHGLLS